ncbi:MAG: cytochrome c oxidase subunit II [Candidatus Parcubacteria bacterium]|nr:cytochrome c oxidase subunit II [Burkholderiales bacterium]
MQTPSIARALSAALVIAAVSCGVLLSASRGGAAEVNRIELSARKFEFSSTEIRVKRGQPVTLVLRTDDFAHGFSVPDFNVRADLVPGRTVEVTFTPGRAGRFDFLCDNFCGEDHDHMSGTIVVLED